jgi:hypothetical protein
VISENERRGHTSNAVFHGLALEIAELIHADCLASTARIAPEDVIYAYKPSC